jgi:S-adenosylhomocysteine hydrolase
MVVYTGDLSLHARYLTDRLVDSVAVSDDGQRLYVASGGRITKVEAATGRPLGILDSAPAALGLLAVGSR